MCNRIVNDLSILRDNFEGHSANLFIFYILKFFMFTNKLFFFKFCIVIGKLRKIP